MKAARLHPGAHALVVEEVPDPVPGAGEVVVRIEAAFASPFTEHIVHGNSYITPPRPFTPGMDAIGRIERLGAGVAGLAAGDRVYCDGYYEAPPPQGGGERIFIGNFAYGAPAAPLLAKWPDGVYAQKLRLPAECAIPLDPDPGLDAAILCRLGWIGTAYGGWRKIGLAPGATVAVNGASGLLGSSAVLVALALGAGKVFALGRREAALRSLAEIDPRIVPATDPESLPALDAALTSIEADSAESIEKLLPRLKRFGAMVFVGYTRQPMSLPTRWLMSNDITLRGSLWFERRQVREMLGLAASRLLPLQRLRPRLFPLAAVGDALAAAASPDRDPVAHVAIDCA